MDGTAKIDEAGLARLVEAFYDRVRTDAELGPIFNDAIDNWPHHLKNPKDFKGFYVDPCISGRCEVGRPSE